MDQAFIAHLRRHSVEKMRLLQIVEPHEMSKIRIYTVIIKSYYMEIRPVPNDYVQYRHQTRFLFMH